MLHARDWSLPTNPYAGSMGLASMIVWLGLLGQTPESESMWLIGGRLQLATLAPRGIDSRRFEVTLTEKKGQLRAQACVFSDVRDDTWNGACFLLRTEKLGPAFVANIAAEPDMPAYDSQAQRLLRELISAGHATLRPNREIIGYDLSAPLEIAGERSPAIEPLTAAR